MCYFVLADFPVVVLVCGLVTGANGPYSISIIDDLMRESWFVWAVIFSFL